LVRPRIPWSLAQVYKMWGRKRWQRGRPVEREVTMEAICLVKSQKKKFFFRNSGKDHIDMGYGDGDEEPMCRICFEEDEQDDNRLISPCKCDGTQKFVHQKCLREWQRSVQTYRPNHPDQVCSICRSRVLALSHMRVWLQSQQLNIDTCMCDLRTREPGIPLSYMHAYINT